jgi:outer membrane protein OmpA-like peptidoglycan-associated protein
MIPMGAHAAGGERAYSGLRLALDASYLWHRNRDSWFAAVGHAVTFGAAAAHLLADGAFQLGPKLYGGAGLPLRSDLTGATVSSEAPMELMHSGKVRFGSLRLGLGGGAAVTRGAGARRARALATLAYAPPSLAAKPKSPDGDGIPDATDACPDSAGPASEDPRKNGCPPGRDGDGVPDEVDACPDSKGLPNPGPTRNGCPKRVVIKLKSIEILQQVQFETGKDVIRKESDGLLAEVAEVLTKHAELMKVSIEGCTDNVGTPVFNLDLSRRRAAAVKSWLVKRGGIDASRLSTWGYGQTRPLLPNNTIGNRQKNRRVEFKILERGR